MNFNAGTLLGVIVAGTVCMLFIGYLLAPTIGDLVKEGGALADYAGIVGIIIPIAVIVIVLMFVLPILGKNKL